MLYEACFYTCWPHSSLLSEPAYVKNWKHIINSLLAVKTKCYTNIWTGLNFKWSNDQQATKKRRLCHHFERPRKQFLYIFYPKKTAILWALSNPSRFPPSSLLKWNKNDALQQVTQIASRLSLLRECFLSCKAHHPCRLVDVPFISEADDTSQQAF